MARTMLLVSSSRSNPIVRMLILLLAMSCVMAARWRILRVNAKGPIALTLETLACGPVTIRSCNWATTIGLRSLRHSIPYGLEGHWRNASWQRSTPETAKRQCKRSRSYHRMIPLAPSAR
jgi:hypothetical protein